MESVKRKKKEKREMIVDLRDFNGWETEAEYWIVLPKKAEKIRRVSVYEEVEE